MVTFCVNASTTTPQKLKLINQDKLQNSLFKNKKIETAYKSAGPTINREAAQFSDRHNGFLSAIHIAFDQHLPLTLSPDHIWLAIAQGFAIHVLNNAEELRSQFVDFKDKKHIEIYNDTFVKGDPNGDWGWLVNQFMDQLEGFIGKKKDLIVCNFSTTTEIEKVASGIVLMEAMSSYFSYGFTTCCGFPEITLLGTQEDWKSVRTKAQALGEFKCEQWSEALVDVLDKFVDAFDGKVDPKFWGSLYKIGGGSGGPYITGWVNVFFPYLKKGKLYGKNTFVPKDEYSWGLGKMCGGPTLDQFPSGFSRAPFRWTYHAEKFDMAFVAGFSAPRQLDNLSLAPEIGWWVLDETKETK